jgi:hypothetical protein
MVEELEKGLERSGSNVIEVPASGTVEKQDKPVRINNVLAEIRKWHVHDNTARPACLVYIRRAYLSIIGWFCQPLSNFLSR